jgi:hypothetical protein
MTVGRKFDTITEEFNIVIDDMELSLEFRITKHWWSFVIRHPWIKEEFNMDEDDAEEGFILLSLSQVHNPTFFPEFISNGGLMEADGGLTEEVVKVFLDRIIAKLEDLAFNKKEGVLVSKSMIRKQIARNCCFGKFIKDEQSDKCCVCHDDNVKSKTPCGHILCIPCWSKLKKKPICPICRDNISHRE